MKDKVVLFSPVVLIMSTALVFRVLSLKLGADWATIIGFSFYQLIWCIIFPFAILGKTEVFRLFRKQVDQSAKESMMAIILLMVTIAGAIPLFIGYLSKYSLVILLIGIPLTTINGVCEEIFWRGLFVGTFKEKFLLASIYPTVFFAVWHISPALIDQRVEFLKVLPFILFTLPLGFIYSIVAFRMKSIKWVAIAHSLSGILAFGVPLSTSVANIIGID